ncbi:MAG: hypothetical protein EXR59_02845 [Dehalococcoidia bacterium]|nr:hypothetical protein [Dehalococcoidia bacterium]
MTTQIATDSARLSLIDTVDQMQNHFKHCLTGLTHEQRYFTLGTCNSIAYTAWHAAEGVDRCINAVVQGKPTLWESTYRAKQGLPADFPLRGYDWEKAKAVRFEPWVIFIEYVDAVMKECHAYLKKSDATELDTIVHEGHMDSAHPRADYAKARVLRGRLTHASVGLGELNVIRGIQGLKGSPN